MSNDIKMKASEISEKFIDAFILFSKCHEYMTVIIYYLMPKLLS